MSGATASAWDGPENAILSAEFSRLGFEADASKEVRYSTCSKLRALAVHALTVCALQYVHYST